MSDLSAKKRRELKESDFGIPEKRLYPMIDAEDVTSAVSLFGKASPKYRKTLAKRILSKAKEFNVDSSGWKTIIQCAQEQVPPMSDGTSIGNTPPLTIDTFNETSKNVFTSGDFNKYKKTDLSNNRGPIIAQEQTLYGIGAYTGDEEHEIPVECPNNMTDDEKLLYQIIFDNHRDFDIINTIIERIVAPLCDKLGLKENAMAVLMKYRHVDNEEDLWDNAFEHSDYVWGYLYPAAKGVIKSDHIAHITFDADCSYIENPKHKRPTGYKQIVVEVELTKNGVINTHVISPTKTESQKLLSFDIAEYRDLVNMRASRDAFEKTCANKIEAILPSDLKKFIKNSDETYYSYPAKYFAALGMFDSIEDISRTYIRDEFDNDPHIKKLNHHDWEKKMEILDDVLKDTTIPIGFSDDFGDLFILYKTSTGEIVESRHGQVLAKSWREFESKLKKTNLRDQHVQEAAVGASLYVQDELFTRVQMLVGESASNDDFFPKRKL